MVAINGISLDACAVGAAEGAVAFSLTEEAEMDRLYRFSGQVWEVELRRGCDQVVVRTTNKVTRSALVNAVIDVTHRALDLVSIEGQEHLNTLVPASNHLLAVRENGEVVVRFTAVSDFPIRSHVSAEINRADGTVEQPPVASSPTWTPAFRFYRLAQGGRDLFDAYRNMFLALEALLDQLFTKKRNEGERAWLLRGVAAAGAKVDLSSLASPGAAAFAGDIVDRLYGIRVQLFHAKSGRTLLPEERVGDTAVAEAYPILVRLCTDIIRGWLDPARGSSVITYQGFRIMIENAFKTATVAVTADDTPATRSDAVVSPRGLPLVTFPSPVQIFEKSPGRMTLEGRTDVAALQTQRSIGRIVVVLDEKAVFVSSINGSLVLDGADRFETAMTLRLVNPQVPRTEFL
jgi:hypothetical protein